MLPEITIYNCETQEVIVREMTEEEHENYLLVGQDALADVVVETPVVDNPIEGEQPQIDDTESDE